MRLPIAGELLPYVVPCLLEVLIAAIVDLRYRWIYGVEPPPQEAEQDVVGRARVLRVQLE